MLSKSSAIMADSLLAMAGIIALAFSARADTPANAPHPDEVCKRDGSACVKVIHRRCEVMAGCSDRLVLRKTDMVPAKVVWTASVPAFMDVLALTRNNAAILITAEGPLLATDAKEKIVLVSVHGGKQHSVSLGKLFPETRGLATASHYKWANHIAIADAQDSVWIEAGDESGWVGYNARSGKRLDKATKPPPDALVLPW